jgi:hypothetical protein
MRDQHMYNEIYSAPAPTDLKSNQEQLEMLTKIRSIIMKEYEHFNDYDIPAIKLEEITKVFLGIEKSDREKTKFYYPDRIKERISTPIQDLVKQSDMIPGTDRNKCILRSVFALLLNNRGAELMPILTNKFPEYFCQIN